MRTKNENLGKNEILELSEDGKSLKIDISTPKHLNTQMWMDLETFKTIKGRICSNGSYPITHINKRGVKVHKLVLNAPNGYEIDHINRDKLDARRSNLRIVTRRQNMRNRVDNNEFIGSCYNKRNNNFLSQIYTNGKYYSLGVYDTAKEASEAYFQASDALSISLECFEEFRVVNLGITIYNKGAK